MRWRLVARSPRGFAARASCPSHVNAARFLSRLAAGASAGAAGAPDSDALREQGNNAFRRGRKREAEGLYTQAIEALDEEDPQRALGLANRSITRLQLKDAKGALSDAEEALSLRPLWGKGLHRRAKALEALGEDIEAFRFVSEALSVPIQESPDVSDAQRSTLQALLESLQLRLQAKHSISTAPESDDAWVAALEVHPNYRLRLATMAHCWNGVETHQRVRILDAALEDLAAAPAPGSCPIASFAAIVEADARGNPNLSPSSIAPQALAGRIRQLSRPAADGPIRAADAGITPDHLKPFPMTNYADLAPPAALVAYFAALPDDRMVALWQATWRRLRFFERVLVANDFAMFFEKVARLCPLLEVAVSKLRASTEAAAAAAAAAAGGGGDGAGGAGAAAAAASAGSRSM